VLEIAGERGSPSPREKRPWFAMTIERKTHSIQQFAKTANYGHYNDL
jgi:hypothetical protein